MIIPEDIIETTVPIETPDKATEAMVDLSSGGDQAAIKTFIAGNVTPPPKPSITRATIRAR